MDSGTGGTTGPSPNSGVQIKSTTELELTGLASSEERKKAVAPHSVLSAGIGGTLMSIAILILFALLVPGRTEIEFVTEDLPWAIAEKGYEAPPLEVRVSGSCPIGGGGYALVSGALPPGMQLSRLGYF